MIPTLLRDIREAVIEVLFHRYVFRTHQEIVRLNHGLQGKPRDTFANWSQGVYDIANSIAVRHLASSTFEPKDVSLVRFLETLIPEVEGLWPAIDSRFPAEVVQAKDAIGNISDWRSLACRRVLDLDLEALVSSVKKIHPFGGKSVPPGVPAAEVGRRFRNLDRAIDTIKQITEKYTLIVCLTEMRRLALDKPSGWILAHDHLDRLKDRDLLEEMKSNRLQKGWDQVFLERWATKERLLLPLGELLPPREAS